MALAATCSALHHDKVHCGQQSQKRVTFLLPPRPGVARSTSMRVLRAAPPADSPRWRKEEHRLKDERLVHQVKPARRRSSLSTPSSSSPLAACYQSVKARFPNLAFSHSPGEGSPVHALRYQGGSALQRPSSLDSPARGQAVGSMQRLHHAAISNAPPPQGGGPATCLDRPSSAANKRAALSTTDSALSSGILLLRARGRGGGASLHRAPRST